MPRTSVEVEIKVWRALDAAYQRKCGRSSSRLVGQLNESGRFPRRKNKQGEMTDVISDRTINQFFKQDGAIKKLNGVYLNYLCQYLLDEESYPDAKQALGVANTPPPQEWQQPVRRKLDEQAYLPKYREYIQQKCGSIRVPYAAMQQQRELQNIYVSTNIREEVQSRKPKSLAQLQAELDGKKSSNVPVLSPDALFDTYKRVMIWGATGSGKTTLLKRWMLQSEEVLGRIPVFISLIDYVKQSQAKGIDLSDAIFQEFILKDFDQSTVTYWSEKKLKEGQFFIALDGLDEIPNHCIADIYDELEQLVYEFPDNTYALTCRLGGTEYPPKDFAEFEVEKWTPEQACTFAKKWFVNFERPEYISEFLKALEENPFISEFKQNPLLLTILCQLHEAGYGVPQNRANILEDAVEFYMRKWDELRRITREPILDKKLSRQRRRDLFTIIAASAMTEGKTFWVSWELKYEIESFIQKLPNVTDSSIKIDADKVLTAIEAQHGLLTKVSKDYYAFAHRSFQEYFVFQDMMDTVGQSTKQIDRLLQKHLLDPNYRNSFLLFAERQRDVEPLLRAISRYLTHISKDDKRVQQNFAWLQKRTEEAVVNTSAWRSLLFSYELETLAFSRSDLSAAKRAEAQRLADNLRKFNKEYKRITLTTARIELFLRLAVVDKMVNDRATSQEGKIFEIDKYDLDYKEYRENLKEKFCDLLDLLSDANVTEAEQAFLELIQAFPDDDAPPEIWRSWQQPFTVMIQKYFKLGYSHSVEVKTIETLNDYIYVAHLLSEILLQDIRCDQQTKYDVLDSLFLPHHLPY